MVEEPRRLGFRQVLGSVLSSFIGVQDNATRERDFRHGRARDFIVVGIVLTAALVLLLWGLVQVVMFAAGG
jgi:hypothetical protein